ncbi:hypothetical protein SLS59_007123 [Nothophoma quercina]|uniref:Uncharacterized protein n=1 Tax=Nothophoma quercina TaxID=749835 RepID=A0ABR3R1G0_9PLEO
MRSFQTIFVFLFALVASVFAADQYDTTVYLTSTVYRVNTVTMSGAAPSSVASNQTSTISAYAAPSVTGSYGTGSYGTGNGTAIKPTGTGSATKPSTPEFTGAASSLNANAFVVALAAGVGYLVL